MIENIASVINSIVDWMQCAILDIDGYSFSMWEILVVGTAGYILGEMIGSTLNLGD